MVDAYKSAYSTDKLTYNSVYVKASRLFSKPHVRAYLQTLQEHAEKAAIMDRTEALKVLSAIGRGGLHHYVDEFGNPDPAKIGQPGPDLQEAEVRFEKDGEMRKIKVRDPVKAIERLAKMQAWDQQSEFDAQGVTFNLNIGNGHDTGNQEASNE